METNAFQMNMLPGVTPISREIYFLHMTIFWICVAIGVGVFSVLFYALIKHRKSAHHRPAKFHSKTWVEVVWAVIPFLILIIMAIPATIVLIRMDDEEKADLNIKITGFQWKWRYEYLDQGISFFSNLSTPRDQIEGKAKKGQWYLLEVDKPLVVPIHKKIRFLLTSNDVIHSWWVPALGVKRDAMPGFIHESWARIERPGVYRGQCAELCGLNHAFMPIVVEAKTQADFDRWVLEQTGKGRPKEPPKTLTKEALMTEGQQVYNTSCAVCHKADGTGSPPAFPAMKGSKIATGVVAAHIDIVMNGKPGTAMQPFKDQLTDEQIAAVITYERNSWGNSAGIVQPTDIFKIRGGKIEAAPTSSSSQTPIEKSTPTPEKSTTTTPNNHPVTNGSFPGYVSNNGNNNDQQKTNDKEKEDEEKKKEEERITFEKMTKDELVARGRQAYEINCAQCHRSDGSGLPPSFPALAGSKIATGSLGAHIDIVLNGKQGTTMQAFRYLPNDELAAIITYERNSWGNDNQDKYGSDAGGIVQSKDIAEAKTGG